MTPALTYSYDLSPAQSTGHAKGGAEGSRALLMDALDLQLDLSMRAESRQRRFAPRKETRLRKKKELVQLGEEAFLESVPTSPDAPSPEDSTIEEASGRESPATVLLERRSTERPVAISGTGNLQKSMPMPEERRRLLEVPKPSEHLFEEAIRPGELAATTEWILQDAFTPAGGETPVEAGSDLLGGSGPASGGAGRASVLDVGLDIESSSPEQQNQGHRSCNLVEQWTEQDLDGSCPRNVGQQALTRAGLLEEACVPSTLDEGPGKMGVEEGAKGLGEVPSGADESDVEEPAVESAVAVALGAQTSGGLMELQEAGRAGEKSALAPMHEATASTRGAGLTSVEAQEAAEPELSLAMVWDALEKNRRCQEALRSALETIESRQRDNEAVRRKLSALATYTRQATKRFARGLDSCEAEFLASASRKRLPPNKVTSSSQFFLAPDGTGPVDNPDVARLSLVKEKYQVAGMERRWSGEEQQGLARGVKQQIQQHRLHQVQEQFRNADPEDQTVEELNARYEQVKEQAITAEDFWNLRQHISWEDVAKLYVPSRTPSECRAQWIEVQDPSTNRGPWTEDEDQRLHYIAEKEHFANWASIADTLGTRRTAAACLMRFQRELNQDSLRSSKWTPAEDELLAKAVARHGSKDWLAVAMEVPGRSKAQCMHRWQKYLQPDLRKGKWTSEEDFALRQAVAAYGTRWKLVSRYVPNRNDVQCRERWVNMLDPSVKKGEWSQDEDTRLLNAVERHGVGRWALVAADLHPRTDSQCKRRYIILTRRKQQKAVEGPPSDETTEVVENIAHMPENGQRAQNQGAKGAKNKKSSGSKITQGATGKARRKVSSVVSKTSEEDGRQAPNVKKEVVAKKTGKAKQQPLTNATSPESCAVDGTRLVKVVKDPVKGPGGRSNKRKREEKGPQQPKPRGTKRQCQVAEPGAELAVVDLGVGGKTEKAARTAARAKAARQARVQARQRAELFVRAVAAVAELCEGPQDVRDEPAGCGYLQGSGDVGQGGALGGDRGADLSAVGRATKELLAAPVMGAMLSLCGAHLEPQRRTGQDKQKGGGAQSEWLRWGAKKARQNQVPVAVLSEVSRNKVMPSGASQGVHQEGRSRDARHLLSTQRLGQGSGAECGDGQSLTAVEALLFEDLEEQPAEENAEGLARLVAELSSPGGQGQVGKSKALIE